MSFVLTYLKHLWALMFCYSMDISTPQDLLMPSFHTTIDIVPWATVHLRIILHSKGLVTHDSFVVKKFAIVPFI